MVATPNGSQNRHDSNHCFTREQWWHRKIVVEVGLFNTSGVLKSWWSWIELAWRRACWFRWLHSIHNGWKPGAEKVIFTLDLSTLTQSEYVYFVRRLDHVIGLEETTASAFDLWYMHKTLMAIFQRPKPLFLWPSIDDVQLMQSVLLTSQEPSTGTPTTYNDIWCDACF